VDLREIGWGGMDWFDLAQDRDQLWTPVNLVMKIWVPYSVVKFLRSWATGGFKRKTQLYGVSWLVKKGVTYFRRH
jgi:hypothetical protein